MHWLVATVTETVVETAQAVTLRLDIPDWPGHRAGQHVDLRLTAEDGYSAQRSYSIASAPDVVPIELTVVGIEDGEVSPYLTTVVDVGDELELRGPIGGWFVWDPTDPRPALLLGGGSGVVPLMAMLRQHARSDAKAPMRLLYSARTQAEILYQDELGSLTDGDRRETVVTLTREEAPGWDGARGRIDVAFLEQTAWPAAQSPVCFVCGPTPFVEAVTGALVGLGHDAGQIRAERFGPTGG